jgi:hypothetical protein
MTREELRSEINRVFLIVAIIAVVGVAAFAIYSYVRRYNEDVAQGLAAAGEVMANRQAER